MRVSKFLCATLAAGLASVPAAAQDARPETKTDAKTETKRETNGETRVKREVIVRRGPRGEDVEVRVGGRGSETRAVLGLHTTSSGKRDTLGLFVASIVSGGPAEQAGLVEGVRIAAVNGVDLRIAAADVEAPEMRGIARRRLERTLAKVKPGDDVELRVWSNNGYRTTRVKTVSAASLAERQRSAREAAREDRAVLGLSLSGTGSQRDTLGIFVTGVHTGGPAEKAGVVEGDRIAAINGVDVRVPREDAGDHALAYARVSRFQRAVRDVKPGAAVELRVYSGGQTKTVRVTAARASELYPNDRRQRGMHTMHGMHGMMLDAPMPVMEAMPPMPPMPPMPGEETFFELELAPHDALEFELEGFEHDGPAAEAPTIAPAAPSIRRAPRAGAVARFTGGVSVAPVRPAVWPAVESVVESAGASATSSSVVLPGLRLAAVVPDLASYFGAGSEDGLFVVEADDEWLPLREGDVVLAVDGRPVRQGDTLTVSLDRGRDVQVEVIRKGERRTLLLRRQG